MSKLFSHLLGWTTLYHVAWTSGLKSGDMTITVRPWITNANWKKTREMVATNIGYEPDEIAIISVTKL